MYIHYGKAYVNDIKIDISSNIGQFSITNQKTINPFSCCESVYLKCGIKFGNDKRFESDV